SIDEATNALVLRDNQIVVDQVIPLEAALHVPAAIVGRDPPSQVPDGGEAGGEHAPVAVLLHGRCAPRAARSCYPHGISLAVDPEVRRADRDVCRRLEGYWETP